MLSIKNSVNDSFNIENDFKYLTPEYFSRATVIERFSQKEVHKTLAEQTAHIKNNVGKNSI